MNPFLLILIILLCYGLTIGSSICPSNCKCSLDNKSIECCLLSSNVTKIPKEDIICSFTAAANDSQLWPYHIGCQPFWRQLRVHLTYSSWQTFPLQTGSLRLSCTEGLERLVIIGSPTSKDGLKQLNSESLQHIFFHTEGNLRLGHLTIQETQLEAIASGFIDQLKSSLIQNVEIYRNPHLTSSGLGIGWLANARNLKVLNLRRNRLTTINLARWGFLSSSLLITLDLSENQISDLKPRSFNRVPKLLTLDLSYNLLTSLPLTIFDGLHDLKVLNLYGNRLTLPGLRIPPINLDMAFPNLTQLILSGNPLLTWNSSLNTSPSLFTRWWLSGPCPVRLTHLYLEELTPIQPVSIESHLLLPPIDWNLCPSLTQITLTSISSIPCIPQRWLGLPLSASVLPHTLRIRPSAVPLCPPTTSHTTVPNSPFQGTPDSVHHFDPTTFPKNIKVDHPMNDPWPIGHLPLDKELDESIFSSSHRRSVVGVSPWLLFGLLFLLFLLTISFVTWGGVHCFRRFYNHKSRSRSVAPSHNSDHIKYTTICHDPCLYALNPTGSVKTVYTPFDFPMNNRNGVAHHLSPYGTKTNLRLLNATDSGMGDSTPVSMQQSFHTNTSPLSASHVSMLCAHNHCCQFVHQHPNSLKYHIPSLTSVRSTNLPPSWCKPEMSPRHFYPDSARFSHQPVGHMPATTSTENISIQPSTVYGDLLDEGGTLSSGPSSMSKDLVDPSS